MIYYFILVLMTLFGSVASLFLKKASGADDFIKMLLNKNIYIGGFLYLTSAILNIYVLHFLEYSVVLPLTSITYVWTMILSYLLLNETITTKKISGVILIFLGAVLVSV